MGNQSSAGNANDANNRCAANAELFRRQSIRKSSVGYAAPSAYVARAKRFMEHELNKSHSLHDLDINDTTTSKKINAKNRRQSTATDTFSTRKRSTIARLNGIANTSTNNSNCASRTSPSPYNDLTEDQYINGFGSAMAASSPPPSASHHNRTASTHSNSGVSETRQKSMKKSEASSHPISMSGREIIQFCFENAPLDFGTRLFTRIYEKRTDYQRFSQQLGREKWYEMAHALRDFLQRVIAKIDNLEAMEKMARKYGEDHLALKAYGFKPDFWVTLADLLTVEGVMLDQATHTHTEAVTAWSLFISILFSSIRDGYYNAMREQRNSIRKRSKARQASVGVAGYGNDSNSSDPVDPSTSPNIASFQQLQIPSMDDSGGFTPSGSLSPIDGALDSAGPFTSQRRSSRRSSTRVASNGGGRKLSAVEYYNRRQSPNPHS